MVSNTWFIAWLNVMEFFTNIVKATLNTEKSYLTEVKLFCNNSQLIRLAAAYLLPLYITRKKNIFNSDVCLFAGIIGSQGESMQHSLDFLYY